MTRRHIHYEAAFEDYLRSCGVPYIAVDEQRKAIFSGNRVKSFDFLVYRDSGIKWLVDVKGRKFPYDTSDGQRRYWENWITREDLEGLRQWEDTFGEGFRAMLVFAYLLLGPPARQPLAFVHPFRDDLYAFMCISLADYRELCRPRSASWDTVSVPAARFRELAQPIQVA
ncbi:MAG: HYExAFE family protein [Phycisphaerales bacterium]|nr:HYExAFE family protein [Phycisphaerales bacterium]